LPVLKSRPGDNAAMAQIWRAFLKSHWDQIAGTDFFTIELWTPTARRSSS
jgi:hypothetical protein